MNYQVVMINQLLYDTPLYQSINKGTFIGEITIYLKLRVSINVHKIIVYKIAIFLRDIVTL
jgi:hypothetical protein